MFWPIEGSPQDFNRTYDFWEVRLPSALPSLYATGGSVYPPYPTDTVRVSASRRDTHFLALSAR